MKKYKYFIGIDISKLTLDLAVMKDDCLLYHRKIDNNIADIVEFVGELKSIVGFRFPNAVFGMEQTGIYSSRLIAVLEKCKANIVNEDANHIKNSLGTLRGKNDKIDAIRIASYLFKSKNCLTLWQGKRQVLKELASLSALRSRLSITIRSLKVPIKEDKLFINEKHARQNEALCSRSIMALADDIALIDSRIKQVWSSDIQLNHLMGRITSIPCIGEMTALQIIIATSEFQAITLPKQFASYAGVAPFPYQSGSSILGRNRVSHMANKKVKTLLHTCAVLSVRFVPEIRAYFIRKTQLEGKHRMLVMNAIRNKLILRVFACVKQDRDYLPEFNTVI